MSQPPGALHRSGPFRSDSAQRLLFRNDEWKVLASVVHATGNFRTGALAVAEFLMVGLGILARVDVRRGAAAAANEVPLEQGSRSIQDNAT